PAAPPAAARAREAAREPPPERILWEPARRTSGPALLAAAARFAADGDPVTAAIPADQTVRDGEAFRRALVEAASLADEAPVVILTAVPTRPEPDFGYVEHQGGRVSGFTEKPRIGQGRRLTDSRPHLLDAGHLAFRSP